MQSLCFVYLHLCIVWSLIGNIFYYMSAEPTGGVIDHLCECAGAFITFFLSVPLSVSRSLSRCLYLFVFSLCLPGSGHPAGTLFVVTLVTQVSAKKTCTGGKGMWLALSLRIS